MIESQLLEKAARSIQAAELVGATISPEVVQELIEGGRSFLEAASRYIEELPGAAGGERGEQG